MSNIIYFPIVKLSECCNARIIWDTCDIHGENCEADACDECLNYLRKDCDK